MNTGPKKLSRKEAVLKIFDVNGWKFLHTVTLQVWGNGEERVLFCPGCGRIKLTYKASKK